MSDCRMNPARNYLKDFKTNACIRDALREKLEQLNREGGNADDIAALQRRIDHLNESLAARLALIDAVPDARQREVLTLRYINDMPWCDIRRRVHYAKTQIFELHRQGLENLWRSMRDSP